MIAVTFLAGTGVFITLVDNGSAVDEGDGRKGGTKVDGDDILFVTGS